MCRPAVPFRSGRPPFNPTVAHSSSRHISTAVNPHISSPPPRGGSCAWGTPLAAAGGPGKPLVRRPPRDGFAHLEKLEKWKRNRKTETYFLLPFAGLVGEKRCFFLLMQMKKKQRKR